MAAVTAIVAASAAVVGNGIQAISANQKAQSAKGKANRARGVLKDMENSRQEIINPYEGYESVAGLASDTSGILKNRFANIGVATQAAEMQIEEADISLANTLDTLAATGASAGGATALAQAALQSKKGVAAGIEKQEVANQQKAAQAEMNIDTAKMSEAKRLQGIEMSEAQRLQQAEAAGKDYEFKTRETREVNALNRQQAIIDNSLREQAAYQNTRDAAIGGAISGLGAVATSVGGLQAEKLAGSGGGSMFDGAKEKLKTSEDFKLDTKVDLSNLGYQGNKGKYKY